MRSGLRAAERLASESARRMQATKKMYGEIPTINPATGAMPSGFVPSGSGKLSGFASLGAAQTMFVSAARDTFASLASGQNPITVFLQQAPQVAQAFTMMKEGAWGFLRSLVLNPIFLTIAALAALGTAIFFVVRHFSNLAKEQKNLKDLMDVTRSTFSERMETQRELIDSTREWMSWNRKLVASENSVADALDRTLAALRAKAKHEQEAAAAGGASQLKLRQMSLAAMKEEIEATKQAVAAAKQQFEQAQTMAAFHRDQKDEFSAYGDADRLKTGKRKLEEQQKIIDELEKRVRTEQVRDYAYVSTGAGSRPYLTSPRAARASDKFSVEGFGMMSLEDAVKRYQEMARIVRELEDTQAKIAEAEKDSKKTAEEKKEILDSLTKKQKSLEDALGLSEKYPGDKIGKASAPYTDSLLAVGNFLGSGRGAVGSIEQQSLDEAKAQTRILTEQGKYIKTIAKNTEKTAGNSMEIPE
jgi:hypothetical protein